MNTASSPNLERATSLSEAKGRPTRHAIGLKARIKCLERENAYLREQVGIPEAESENAGLNEAFPGNAVLTSSEHAVLAILWRNRQRYISTTTIHAWLYSDRAEKETPEYKTIEIFILRVRNFLKSPRHNPQGFAILTRRHFGWKLCSLAEVEQVKKDNPTRFKSPNDPQALISSLRRQITLLKVRLEKYEGKKNIPDWIQALQMPLTQERIFARLVQSGYGHIHRTCTQELAAFAEVHRSTVSNTICDIRQVLLLKNIPISICSQPGVRRSPGYWLEKKPVEKTK